MIEFKRKCSMENGNKITKKNWHKIVAVSSKPCTNVRGIRAIDEIINAGGEYFEKWKLVYEPQDELDKKHNFRDGYIFREVNHGGGICGRHKTAKMAVWTAIRSYIIIYIED